MKTYTLTAFSKSGGKLLDETFTAHSDQDAENIGKRKLIKNGYQNCTHRCVSEDAKLILFHR